MLTRYAAILLFFLLSSSNAFTLIMQTAEESQPETQEPVQEEQVPEEAPDPPPQEEGQTEEEEEPVEDPAAPQIPESVPEEDPPQENAEPPVAEPQTEEEETPELDPTEATEGTAEMAQPETEPGEDRPQSEPMQGEVAPSSDTSEATAPREAPLDPAVDILAPVVDYNLEAKLNVVDKKIQGHLMLRYTNHSPDLIGNLHFHLYPNAFKNSGASMFHDVAPSRGVDRFWRYLHIFSLAADGVDLTSRLDYHRSEGAVEQDQSVLFVPLVEPLLPGQTITITCTFETKLGKGWLGRSAFGDDDYYLIAQWYPKIAVWETRGKRGRETPGWNSHSFHLTTEFYADFGNYKVRIEAPREHVVGATGKLTDTGPASGGATYYVFEQDRVHDFAFTTSPRFLREERIYDPADWTDEATYQKVMSELGVTREDLNLDPVTMILLIQYDHADQADRHFEALAQAITYMGLWFGDYPYDTITMVDPSPKAISTWGMEYPTFITLGTRLYPSKRDLDLEDVIVHEFVHQYFQGMVASNEIEESWLDEGITSYLTARILDQIHGPQPVFLSVNRLARRLGLNLANINMQRAGDRQLPLTQLVGIPDLTRQERTRREALAEGGMDAIVKPGWLFQPPSGYYYNAYDKPAAALFQLEAELGTSVMQRIMRTFFREWRFRHPHTQDFIEVVNRVSGKDMQWFFDELFFKPGTLDYRIGLVDSRSIDRAMGFTGGPGPDPPRMFTKEDKTPDFFNRVVIENKGNIHYPVAIHVTFGDDHVEILPYQGERWRAYDLKHPSRIERVEIDPDGKLIVDRRRTDNVYLRRPSSERTDHWTVSLLLRAQHLLEGIPGGLWP